MNIESLKVNIHQIAFDTILFIYTHFIFIAVITKKIAIPALVSLNTVLIIMPIFFLFVLWYIMNAMMIFNDEGIKYISGPSGFFFFITLIIAFIEGPKIIAEPFKQKWVPFETTYLLRSLLALVLGFVLSLTTKHLGKKLLERINDKTVAESLGLAFRTVFATLTAAVMCTWDLFLMSSLVNGPTAISTVQLVMWIIFSGLLVMRCVIFLIPPIRIPNILFGLSVCVYYLYMAFTLIPR